MPDVKWLQKWTELVSSANTVAELCKKLVHSKVNPGDGVGCYLYLLDNKGQISVLGGYGINPLEADNNISTWDQHILAKAIRETKLAHASVEYQGSPMHCYALPILRGTEPLGTVMFCQREKVAEMSPETNLAMGQVLGLWLHSAGLTNGWNGNGSASEASPESLTDRQLKVLYLMSLGKTNAEIAQELILSESSIRQETVKIYRILGVSSRSEATKRAVHLGVLTPQAG